MVAFEEDPAGRRSIEFASMLAPPLQHDWRATAVQL